MFAPRMILAVTVLAMGCGGDDDSGTPPDASVDAPPDAPPPLMGLGQSCNAMGDGTDCPQGSGCLSFQGSTGGMCSPICVTNGSFMTDSNKMIIPSSLMPADASANDGTCSAAYTGTVGTPACHLAGMVNRMPTGALAADTSYTYLIACMIKCGASNECPSGFTCDSSVASFPFCKPN